MALIEGFQVRNYRSLRDITLGRLPSQKVPPLTPLTVVIGKNGAGKSTLFDAFGFLSDCLSAGVEAACDRPQRGGFERMRSLGTRDAIQFQIHYRQSKNDRPIHYELSIDADELGRPFVRHEILKQARKGATRGRLFPFLNLSSGQGSAWAGEDAVEETEGQESKEKIAVALSDARQLGIATLGSLRDHPRITRFRDFMRGWYLSYFTPDAARGLPVAGPQRHLNVHGDNLGNVVQFMEREHKDKFKSILTRISKRIPGISKIETHVTEDKRVLLRFNDTGFQDPFYAQQMSDGTLKLFAYMLMLEDPEPPPFMCIEEPENGLYHKLLETLANEFRSHATGKANAPQIFVTTHQPYFVDALTPEEVWILQKGADGFSTITQASSIDLVRNLSAEELPLGGLWYSDYLDAR